MLAGGVVVVALAVAGCSSNNGAKPAAGSAPSDTPTATASPTPTGPNKAVCDAARALVAGAQPTFSADAEASVLKQSADDSAFYTQLLLVFSENGGGDPLSQPVSEDASHHAADYQALETAAQQSNLDGQTDALHDLSADLEQMTKDQVPFDQACGIPAIVNS
jgi:hypothetical protein